jgi:hypothetical protein
MDCYTLLNLPWHHGSQSPWTSLSDSHYQKGILRFGWWLTILQKMAYCVPLEDNAKKVLDLALVFANKIWQYHSLPTDIVLD